MAGALRVLRAVYPYLTAATPVFYLAVRNAAQVVPTQTLLPLALLLFATGLAVAALSRALDDRPRAAVLVTVALIALFTGGSLLGSLTGALGASLEWAALALALAVAAAALWGAWRFTAGGTQRVQAAQTTLSVMALVLFLNMAVPLLFTAKGWEFFSPDRIGFAEAAPAHPVRAAESAQFPDIYYIISDAYARDDVLRRMYGFDNAEFLGWLESRGFYVARESWANYPATYLSLASSLNMQLLQELLPGFGRGDGEVDRAPLYELIQRPAVATRLQAHGYRYAQVLTHWGGTDRAVAADLRYKFAPFLGGEFSSTLLGMTLLRPLLPTVDRLHHFVVESAQDIADVPGPTFAFVHLLLPHNPYVFDRDGQVIASYPLTISLDLQARAWRLREPYVEQLRYTNTLLRRMIEGILARSRVPPIIVLQGDHGSSLSGFSESRKGLGPEPRERLAILNAFLAPPAVRAKLYPGITPANSFRVLLSTQFGDDLPPVPDASYYGKGESTRGLRDVSAELRAGVTPAASTSSR